MTPSEERADGVDLLRRDVVWSAGDDPAHHGRWRALRRWLLLVVLAGLASFALAYVLHLATAATPAQPAPSAPMWLPHGPDGCRGPVTSHQG